MKTTIDIEDFKNYIYEHEIASTGTKVLVAVIDFNNSLIMYRYGIRGAEKSYLARTLEGAILKYNEL